MYLCNLTGLPATRKHRGLFICDAYFDGAKRLSIRYNISEFEAMDILLSYKSGVSVLGEEKLEPETLRKEGSWKKKLKNLITMKKK